MPTLLICFQRFCFALVLSLMVGCVQLTTPDEVPPANDQTQAPPVVMAMDSETLLDFSLAVSKLPSSTQADLCRSLLKRQKGMPNIDTQVQILVGRLFSEVCGDAPKILESVAANPNFDQFDEPSQKLIAVYSSILKRMQLFSKKLAVLERKQKSLQNNADGKNSKIPKSSQEESQLLRDKLEAIRSMEKQLDEADPNPN